MDLLKTDIKKLYRSYLVPSLSAAVVTSVYSFVDMIAIGRGVGADGAAALTVFGVIITCSSMFQHLFSGVGQAIQPIVSTNFGAGQIQRIREVDKLSVMTALVMGLVFALTGVLFPLQLTTFFVDATPEIMGIAPGIVRVYFLSFLPMGVNIQATYYLQSAMRTKWSNILSLLRGLLLSGALVYLLPVLWGIDGVWWAMVITESVVVVFAVMCLRKADKDGLQGLKIDD